MWDVITCAYPNFKWVLAMKKLNVVLLMEIYFIMQKISSEYFLVVRQEELCEHRFACELQVHLKRKSYVICNVHIACFIGENELPIMLQ